MSETIELPESGTKRWVIKHKMQVVHAIRQGVISVEEACVRYSLSLDEINTWIKRANTFGALGLRATLTQFYRDKMKETEK